MRKLILASLAISSALAAQAPAPAARRGNLEQRVRPLLDQAPFDRASWGVHVMDSTGRVLFTRNGDRLFMPASVTKLVVTAAASVLLPPDFRVRTSVYAHGAVRNGVLAGDLILYGRGDPAVSTRCYNVDTLAPGACDSAWTTIAALADSIAARGIQRITGQVVGDGSYFEPLLVHPQWSVFDTEWWYAAPVSGLAFNDNSVDFHITPADVVGRPPTIVGWPDWAQWTLENRGRTGPADSGSSITDGFFRRPGTWNWRAEGAAALGRRPWTESAAVPDPNLYAARGLAEALRRRGIAVEGGAASTTDSLAYATARAAPPLVERLGRPLPDLLFPILNVSQNLFAEMLCKLVAREVTGVGSWSACLDLERRFLIDSVKVDSSAFALDDGSGLSAGNLVSPAAFTQLLAFMARHPRSGAFFAALPRSGGVGSIRRRFIGTPVEGKVWAKTGSIYRVSTLAGYVQRPDGKRVMFAVMVNGQTMSSRQILNQIDSVVVEIGRR